MERVADRKVVEADQLRELVMTFQGKPANINAIFQFKQYFAMGA